MNFTVKYNGVWLPACARPASCGREHASAGAWIVRQATGLFCRRSGHCRVEWGHSAVFFPTDVETMLRCKFTGMRHPRFVGGLSLTAKRDSIAAKPQDGH